ncbi:MAG: alpha/beta hydrolase fold domain-containing protein [Reyranellaceae bacterium]
MPSSTEIVRDLQGIAASLALRLPISWVNLLTGPAVSVDGRLLDARTQWYLQLVARSGRPPLEQQSVEEARRDFDAFMPVLSGSVTSIGGILDRTIAGPGGALRIRVYQPTGTVARLVPAILYLHGGGWTIGSLEAYDRICRFYCARTGCAVVAVDYRLAPEHKFPAAVEDALAAYRWLTAAGADIGIDAARIVVAGDSAGGTLAAVLAQELRAETPSPCLQWLVYPATDLAMDTPSFTSCGDGFLLTRAGAIWFRSHYLKYTREIEDPRASPLRGADLSGVAPALVYTAGFDPLRDEGRAYADRLTAAGVKTIHREFDSLIHGFAGLRGPIQAAARAMDEMVAGVRHELTQLGR